jgi:Signal peptidase (SPase) II
VFNERHLRHVLLSYMNYCNETRTHLSLDKDAPLSRTVKRAGRILCRPVLGRLHHQYIRPILAMGLTLILGGALGNMLDRARIGSAIGFVHVSYKAWSFAVFNFADAAITMGVIATIASTYLETPSVCADSQGNHGLTDHAH